MGLDVSHDCFSGGYSGFNVWRNQVALVCDVPLGLMEGYSDRVVEAINLITKGMPEFMRYNIDADLLAHLPIKWEALKPDAIHVLLDHSDCDGIIEAKDCLPLAERLEEIAPLLPGAESSFHINMQAVALKFATGLRLAASNNEDVEFR